MQISKWVENRKTPGTLADVARRVLESDAKYREIEKTLQRMYVLEALMRHGGNQTRAAEAIGVDRHTVQRTLRSMGLSGDDVCRVAQRLGEGQ